MRDGTCQLRSQPVRGTLLHWPVHFQPASIPGRRSPQHIPGLRVIIPILPALLDKHNFLLIGLRGPGPKSSSHSCFLWFHFYAELDFPLLCVFIVLYAAPIPLSPLLGCQLICARTHWAQCLPRWGLVSSLLMEGRRLKRDGDRVANEETTDRMERNETALNQADPAPSCMDQQQYVFGSDGVPTHQTRHIYNRKMSFPLHFVLCL